MMSDSHSIAGCLAFAAAELRDASESARRDAEIFLCSVLGCQRAYLFAYSEHLLDAPQHDLFLRQVMRRKNGEPVAYITGRREFWSLPLKVNATTLIPRPETELLVELALQICQKPDAHVIDLGTGTGAIALALASEKPAWKIDAVDLRDDAVLLARDNADSLGLHNVHIYCSGWFASVSREGRIAGDCFDMVVSNPPYVAQDDRHLAEGDVRFEPHSALVAGEHGYADLFFIASEARHYLCDDGLLLLEHGYTQGERLCEYLRQCGYENVQTVKDYNGHDRVTWAVWPGETMRG